VVEPHARVVIVTALRLEYAAVRSQLRDIKEVHHDQGTIYEVGMLIDTTYPWEVALVLSGMGNVAAGIETERAIATFDPEIVGFVGVAGGIKDVKLGDVVIGTKVYGYEGGKAEADFLPRPSVGETSYRLRQIAEAVQRSGQWPNRIHESARLVDVIAGPIVAGEKVIAATTSDVYCLLRSHYSDAIAVEMESAGFVHALHCNQPRESLIIRGISDLIDQKGDCDSAGWQQRAAMRAAGFAMAVIATVEPTGIHKRGHGVPASSPACGHPTPLEVNEELWDRLRHLMERLYPTGPRHEELWRRAGGDLAALGPSASGRAWWFDSLARLRNGGGGAITVSTLLKVVREDYPNDGEAEDIEVLVKGTGDR